MNERIRELYNKASVYAYEQNPGENSYGRPVDENKYEEDRYTKFAELIVRDCVVIVSKRKNQAIDDGWNVDEAMTMAEMDLEEHFGIE